MTPRVAVLSGFGINCETETMAVFEMSGAHADRVHVNRLVNGDLNLSDYQIMAIPGGFSFGDHLGSGRLMGNRLRFGLRDQVRGFVREGRPLSSTQRVHAYGQRGSSASGSQCGMGRESSSQTIPT